MMDKRYTVHTPFATTRYLSIEGGAPFASFDATDDGKTVLGVLSAAIAKAGGTLTDLDTLEVVAGDIGEMVG